MYRIIFFIQSLLSVCLFFSCSHEPIRKVTPANAEVGQDGRIKSRSSAENKKKVDYYNNLQHNGTDKK
jgi:hypothetical protein